MLEKIFGFKKHNTTFSREVIAGLVTFMTMAYIIFTNPSILSDVMGKEYFQGLVVATCLGAALTTFCMGIFTNYPLALASGMGLNAVLAYTLIKGMNVSWQVAMGVVVIEGVLITIMVLTRVREWIMDAIPMDLKRSIGVGIGLFIALIGLIKSRLVVANPDTLITFGKLGPESLIALFGLIVTALLMARKVKGALLIGIILSTCTAAVAGMVTMPKEWVTGIKPEYFRTFFAADIFGALKWGLASIIFAFVISDFFDAMGTIVAVGEQAGFVTKDGKIPRLRNALAVDSMAAVVGGAFGCSSITTYIESASGVGEGGRTGLTSIITAVLFILFIFFTPVIQIVPFYATAPALIIVGFLMLTIVKSIDWTDYTTAIPAFLIIIMIPFTYNIAKGIGYGFIAYVLLKLFTGRFKEIRPLMYIVAAAFAASFFIPGT